jgi:hypothetical protein
MLIFMTASYMLSYPCACLHRKLLTHLANSATCCAALLCAAMSSGPVITHATPERYLTYATEPQRKHISVASSAPQVGAERVKKPKRASRNGAVPAQATPPGPPKECSSSLGFRF